jgi:hypothetical protein
MSQGHTDPLLTYLVTRLVRAQGFHTYGMDGRCYDTTAILANVRKQSRCAKGGRHSLVLSRRYGKHPQERSTAMTVTLYLQAKDNGLTFDKRGPKASKTQAIEITVPIRYWPTREYETTKVEITKSYRDVWLGIVEAIEGFRAERKREQRHHA